MKLASNTWPLSRSLFWLLLAAILALSTEAYAAKNDRPLINGMRAFKEMNFERAAVLLARALDNPRLNEAERVAALAALARTLAILMKPEESRRRFVQLLLLSPGFRVDVRETPRVRAAFAAAQEQVAADVMRPRPGPREIIARPEPGPTEPTVPAEATETEPTTTATDPPEPVTPPMVEITPTTPPEPTDDQRSWWTVPLIAGGVLAVMSAIIAGTVIASKRPEPVDGLIGTWDLP